MNRKQETGKSALANMLTPFNSPSPAELDGFAFSLEKGDHEVVLRCVLGQLFPHPRCADPLPGEGWDSLLTREGWEACDVFT